LNQGVERVKRAERPGFKPRSGRSVPTNQRAVSIANRESGRNETTLKGLNLRTTERSERSPPGSNPAPGVSVDADYDRGAKRLVPC